jgi:hypothetical protein
LFSPCPEWTLLLFSVQLFSSCPEWTFLLFSVPCKIVHSGQGENNWTEKSKSVHSRQGENRTEQKRVKLFTLGKEKTEQNRKE